VVLSWAMRFDMRLGQQIASLLYPLDTFSMYARMPGAEDVGHLLVRDRQGTVHRVTDFRSFDCVEPVNGSAAHCADRRGIPYHYDDLAHYIQNHTGSGVVDVDLITRTWELRAGSAPVRTSDCIVTHCKVAR
jgi:hypothetical protein